MATTSLEVANLFNVKGLVAVITGGGSGIGLMMARALALNGASKVYILGRRENTLKEAAASVSTGNIIPVVCDVTSKDALLSAVQHIEKEVGYINVLIANSGTGGPQAKGITPETTLEEFQRTLWETDAQEYDATFSLNATAAWFTIVAFLGLLDKGNSKGNVEQKSQVICTASIAAYNKATPGGFAYGQSKAAANHMVKQLALALVPHNIRANTICPGLYPSDMASPILEKFGGNFPKTMIPLQRTGTEEDMAGIILFMTSKAGAYLSGSVLMTDGGRLSIMPATF